MKVRAALLIVTLLPLGATGSALASTKAKPKPVKAVCNLVTDPAGDAALAAAPGEGNDDILSADVASDGKTLTAVLRLGALDTPDPQAPMGHNYIISFGAKGAENPLFLAARTYATGTKYYFGYQTADTSLPVTLNISYPLGEAKGTLDAAKKEIHISAPNAAFGPAGTKLPVGAKVMGITAFSYRFVFGQGLVPSQYVAGHWAPLGGLSEQFDTASGGNYVIGTPSCVKPGH